MSANGFGPDQNKHTGVGNPEWDKRYARAVLGKHAPPGMCLCRRLDGESGKMGTFLMRESSHRNAQGLYVQSTKLYWADFDCMTATGKRLCCLGYQMTIAGGWETLDGVPIQVDTRRKIARSRLRKWARSVKARPYALHWLEEHARAVEKRRLAKVADALARGSMYDPDDDADY